MSADRSRGAPTAPLSGSLLARKGTANVSGFAGAADAGLPAPAPLCRRQDAQKRPTILIVEDDLLNRKLMTDLFEAEGYSALEAENGQQAITLARAARPDVIVMDLQLPRLSGLDAIRQLKSDGDLMSIPVLAVSAMVRSGSDGIIRAAGFDEFLAKPFTLQRMLLTVSRLLH